MKCILYDILTFSVQFPEFLTEASAAERLKDFRLRYK